MSEAPPPAPIKEPFDLLPIDSRVKASLKSLGFDFMMPIQSQAIPLIIQGKDILAAAKTGSGKTLAFLVPAINMLYSTQAEGTSVLIIAPTRELALQTHEVASNLCRGSAFTAGVAIGGTYKKAETKNLLSGVNILVATPGRLVDHLIGTKGFFLSKVKLFVIDEADRMLEDGYSNQLHEIVSNLPEDRQTVLFSATQKRNDEVTALAKVSFRQSPIYIGVDDESDSSTAEGLTQAYVVTKAEKRLLVLATFLRHNRSKKVMVFFGTKASVKFHLLFLKYLGISALAIHGDQSQQKRIDAFNEFRKLKSGIMLCTDVAARGLDIPAVEWIVQYDPPTSEKDYIHRVGRSARAGAEGKAILFLLENEIEFLKHLEAAKVPLKEYKVPEEKLLKIDRLMDSALLSDEKMMKAAKEALKSYLMGYDSHPMKDCFDVEKLDIVGISKSFCFQEMPHLDIKVVSASQKGDADWIQKEKAKKQK